MAAREIWLFRYNTKIVTQHELIEEKAAAAVAAVSGRPPSLSLGSTSNDGNELGERLTDDGRTGGRTDGRIEPPLQSSFQWLLHQSERIRLEAYFGEFESSQKAA